jgi:hypothetical protein
MKKIIAAFDGLKYSDSTKEYAIYVAKNTDGHLVGVFMDDSIYTSYKIYELVAKEGVSQKKLIQLAEKDKATRAWAAANFEKECQTNKLEYSLHHDKNIAIQELKQESIYADILVINVSETLTHYTEKLPTRFIRDLLADTQCPVLIVPDKYKPVKKIVLLYDGEPSSVNAIKMFSYLLPQLKDLETEVIAVNNPGAGQHIPDNRLIKEYIRRQYPKVKYSVLKGFAEDEIVTHLKKKTKIHWWYWVPAQEVR